MLSIAILACAACWVDPVTLYVSPDGNSKNSGTAATQPLGSLTAARDAVRAMRASGKALGPVNIELAPGTYYLPETFTLESQDSGTVESSVTYAAQRPNTVTISGGLGLSKWNTAALDGTPVFSASIPESVPAELLRDFHTVWVQPAQGAEQKRLTAARYPTEGSFLKIGSMPEAEKSTNWMHGVKAFQYSKNDAAIWERVQPGAEVTTFARWIDSHLTVKSIDKATRTVNFELPSTTLLMDGDLYYIENDRSLLSNDGEFWCDPAARQLYADKTRFDGSAAVVVPRLSKIMEIRGTGDAPVSHVHFKNLTFAHARWWFAPEPFTEFGGTKSRGFLQAAAACPGAVTADYLRDSTFDNCTVAHVEQYGLELRRGCKDNVIDGCTITDLGAGAIKIGETTIAEQLQDKTERNTLIGCTLTDGGRIHHQAVGVWIGQSRENSLLHNLISDFDYTGISIGWTWGYGPADAEANLVKYNEVRNLGMRRGNKEPPLGDMAGIYTLGNQARTLISMNYFHDIAGRTIAWGIYLDEGTQDIRVADNVVARTTHGGFHQHYGKNNTVEANIFAFGRDAQLWRTRKEEHNSFTFRNNIIIAAPGANLLSGDWTGNLIASGNIFWHTDNSPFAFPGNQTFEQWRDSLQDSTSKVMDPEFEPSQSDQFVFKETSAAHNVVDEGTWLYYRYGHSYGPRSRMPK